MTDKDNNNKNKDDEIKEKVHESVKNTLEGNKTLSSLFTGRTLGDLARESLTGLEVPETINKALRGISIGESITNIFENDEDLWSKLDIPEPDPKADLTDIWDKLDDIESLLKELINLIKERNK